MKKIISLIVILVVFISSFTLCVTAQTEEDKWLYYENDFSDATTLGDFKQYCANWEIKDGVLQIASKKTGFGDNTWVLFNTEDKLTDYIIEVDMLDHQTSSGVIFRSDIDKSYESSNDSYYGYLAFLSADSTKGALGYGNNSGQYGSNISNSVKSIGTTRGADVHLKVEVKGKNITYTISDLAQTAQLYSFTCEHETWANGTFGLRAKFGKEGYETIGNLKFDNLKVYTTDKDWKAETPLSTLTGHSATLGENVGLNFHTRLAPQVIADTSAVMRFTVGSKTPVDIKVSDITPEADGTYKFTCPVAAKEMTDDIKAQIITSAGTTDVYTKTVASYIEELITTSNDANVTALAKSLLNYGAEAQLKFSHNTDKLANASLAAAEENKVTPVDAEVLKDYTRTVTGTVDGVEYVGSTALWNSYTCIRHYFKIEDGKNVTFTYGGNELTKVEKDGMYYVEISDILPQEMDDTLTLTVSEDASDMTVTYSVYAYFASMINGNNQSMLNAVYSAYAYSKAAIDMETHA